MSYSRDLHSIRDGLLSARRIAASQGLTVDVISAQHDIDAIDRALADEDRIDLAESNRGRTRMCLETGALFTSDDPAKRFVTKAAADAYHARQGAGYAL